MELNVTHKFAILSLKHPLTVLIADIIVCKKENYRLTGFTGQNLASGKKFASTWITERNGEHYKRLVQSSGNIDINEI